MKVTMLSIKVGAHYVLEDNREPKGVFATFTRAGSTHDGASTSCSSSDDVYRNQRMSYCCVTVRDVGNCMMMRGRTLNLLLN